MIIDKSYFFNKLNLPQIGNTEGEAEVNSFIEQYETEYLQCVLGFDLWQAFIEGIDGSGLPNEQRWIDLLEGKNFSYKGCNYRWNGFKPVLPPLKISPIANYVFYQFADNKTTDFALIGEVVSDTDNNRKVSPVDRMVDVWNRMVDMNDKLRKFLLANKSFYPEYKEDSCGCNCDCDCGCDCNICELYKKKNTLGL